MKNPRGSFHSFLDDHFGITMAAVVVLCVWGALASADTHPKDGDVEQAPLVSGAVPKADAQPQGGSTSNNGEDR